MAYYQYYQNPGWGTPQYQFQPPPVPSYQPAASWTPYDFYNAHADMNDSSLFDYVFSKIRNVFTGEAASRGEAEHWHRRIYGGFVDIRQLLPREIGAAAAWETLRLWQSHNALYSNPLAGVRERECESIMGLAIAEAARLWNYVGRPLDKYGRREAAEVAGATASRLYAQLYDYESPYDPYRTGSRWGPLDDEYPSHAPPLRHRGSFSGFPLESNYGHSYAGSAYGSTYGSASPIPVPYAGSGYSGYSQPYASGAYLSASPYPQAASYGSPYGAGLGGTMYSQPPLSTGSTGQVIIHTDSTSGGGHRDRSHKHRRSSSSSRHRRHRSRSRSTSAYPPAVAYSTGSYM